MNISTPFRVENPPKGGLAITVASVATIPQRPKAAGGVWGRAPQSAAGAKFFGVWEG